MMTKFGDGFISLPARGNILFELLEGISVIDGIIGFCDLPRGTSRLPCGLKNNGWWLFNIEVCCHNVENLINARDIVEIVP